MPLLFAATLFVSASLLFMVQPMLGRMILPLLGGSPAAWNTCMVFFQAMLLLGYLYAHKVTNRFSPKHQVSFHLGVLGFAVLTFGVAAMLSPGHSPIAVVKDIVPQDTAYPMFGVLALLFVAIGVPFFAVSTSAPLLQRWFAYTGHPAAKDPYFLYAASNAGSLISLLGYPLVTEPSLRLIEQAWVWAIGFGLLGLMIYLCGRHVRRDPPPPPKPHGKAQPPAVSTVPEPAAPAPVWGRKLRWLGLAFVPSSLMLGVTTHMTTDIASVPLLWVLPLAMYLLTFIIAYARLPDWFRPVLGNLSPVLTLLLVFLLASQETSSFSTFWMIALHLVVYFFAALMCHTELAFDRPPPAHLTNYFLWISVGGMLGGVFNALVAPVAFPLTWEYPIAIAVGCMLIPKLYDDKKDTGEKAEGKVAMARMFDVFVPLAMLAAVGGLSKLPDWGPFQQMCAWVAEQLSAGLQFARMQAQFSPDKIQNLILWALPVMACFFFIDRPIRFGLCVAAILLVSHIRQTENFVIKTVRSYFGILKVEDFTYTRRLVHGTTLHGVQITDPWPFRDELKEPYASVVGPAAVYGWDFRKEPLTYYHRTGPVGHMFEVMRAKDPKAHFGMVGLGTGSVSCYALPGQKLTYYEIDPAVQALVADRSDYFTYVQDARDRGAHIDIVLGDARLKLEEQTDRRYQLLLVDAFSSDSIPIHLLTKEAVKLYMERITDDGVVGLHISNKYVKLEPVVARIAEELGLSARVFSDGNEGPVGKTASSWVAVARKEEHLGAIVRTEGEGALGLSWKPLKGDPVVRAWTDDYSDVLSVMMLKEVQRARRLFGLPVMQELAE